MSIFLFTKSDKDEPGIQKKRRNGVYITCGIIMIVCLLVIGLIKLAGWQEQLAGLKPTYWMEFVALWAFGISWAVKGEIMLQDKKPSHK